MQNLAQKKTAAERFVRELNGAFPNEIELQHWGCHALQRLLPFKHEIVDAGGIGTLATVIEMHKDNSTDTYLQDLARDVLKALL